MNYRLNLSSDQLDRGLFALPFFLTLFSVILFCLQPSYARDVAQEEHDLDPSYQRCIGELFSHPSMNAFVQAMKEREPITYGPLKEIDQYCQCSSREWQKQHIFNKKNFFDHAFSDRLGLFTELDQCALNNLGRPLIDVVYFIQVEAHLRQLLTNRLEERYPASITTVATDSSYEARLECMQRQIMKECTRVSSLLMSYRCIKDYLGSVKKIQQSAVHCPLFSTIDSISAFEGERL